MENDFNKQNTLPGIKAHEATPNSMALPKAIGPYKIEAILDQGGMSLLYLATHPKNNDTITVKVLSPQYISHPEMVKRFLNEAAIIGMSNHPNIVKLYGQGEWENGLYIAMEYIQGVSLRKYITQHPMSLKRALEAILEIAYAICHLHTHGVIHRDLKPENILVTDDMHIKVIDFGIAQVLTQPNESTKNQFMGTPVYMSPEQRKTPDEVSYPSDIYSLGIIAYELVLGRLSHGKVHLGILPKSLQSILSKALQPKVENRYQDIVDFIADISTYLNSPALKREKNETNQQSVLWENLQSAQHQILQEKAPSWPKMEIGVISHKGVTISGLYYDFFELPDGAYGIVMAEPAALGAEGLVYTAVLRGIVRTLARLTSKSDELITILNELVCQDPIDQIFTLSYLILNPTENQMHYISCGYGHLWHLPAGIDTPKKITANNIALGIDRKAEFLVVSKSWNVGDTLILNTFAPLASNKIKNNFFTEKEFKKTLSENVYKPPQKQVEILFHKAMIAFSSILEGRCVGIIGILRND